MYHQNIPLPTFMPGTWLENLHGLAASLSFESICRNAPYHLSHLILLHEVVKYRRFTPFLKQTLWWQTMGGCFNLNEVLIRRERGNNTCSSLNICLVLLATPWILSHVGAKKALLARRSGKTVIGRNYA